MTRKRLDVDGGNYTRLHNQILEAIINQPFSARQLRVILAVVRLLYGFNRTHAYLTAREIASLTNMGDNHVRNEMRALCDMNVLIITDRKVSFNKYFDTWMVEKKHGRFPDNSKNEIENPKLGSCNGIPNEDPKLGSYVDGSGSQDGILSWDPESGSLTGSNAAQEANPQTPKDMERHERHDVVSYKHSVNMSIEEPESEEKPPDNRVIFLGFDRLAAVFVRLSGKGGAILNDFKRRELMELVRESGMTCAEIQAVMESWESSRRNSGQRVPVISSPNYFATLLKAARENGERQKGNEESTTALDAYFVN